MKLFGALALLIAGLTLITGCAAPVAYGGAYGGVYGEYPSTYYGQYYSAPVYTYSYPYYRGYHGHWAPYDRDHYFDRGYHWNRHGYYHRD